MKKHLLLLSLAASAMLADTFTLGQVNVLNAPMDENPFEEAVTPEMIDRTNAENVASALDNLSGINIDNQGGRGETTLYVRGFDARHVGVFIDGVPVYVPYDGNFDYGRFLIADIGQIDVAKGFSSIAYGANTMGGVVNIVSKKPTRPLEGNIKAGMVLDSAGSLSRTVSSLNVGTRQERFYAQLGAVYADQDHFRLSDSYTATATQPAGERLRSASEDYKVSLKAGYVADDGSEIAAGYAKQNGQKQQPPVTDTSFSKVKYWDWPYWDKETFFVTGQKNLSNGYLKAMAYHDSFKNSLYAYDDATYSSMTKGSSFKSKYDDYSAGARLEYGVDLGNHTLTAAANYKKDLHRGYDIGKTTGIETLTENYEDHTISLGLEDVYTLSSEWQILGGVSYDRREGDKLYDTTTAYQNLLTLTTQDAFNPEAALIYSPDASSKIRASIARKTYLPSMKERYSRRFGQAIPNPDLTNEQATHYELSYQKRFDEVTARVNAFITHREDAIQNVIDTTTGLYQFRNTGTYDHRGGEAELSYRSDGVNAGGNYTYISVKNCDDDGIKIIDVPKHQLYAYIEKELGLGFSLYGDMKFRKGAYEQKLDASYTLNTTYATFDIKALYQPTRSISAEIGVKNLTDRLYAYDMGYPMAGREFFANIGYNF